jgi:hypothetical protein
MIGLIDGIIRGQIIAGREARPCAADDRDRDIAVAIGRFERLENFGTQPVVQRIALLRAVQRDASHPRPRIVDENMLIGHWPAPHDFFACAGHHARRILP